MAEDDTVPFNALTDDDFPWVVNREDHDVTEPTEPTPKIPEPALVRAVIVSGIGLASAVVGKAFGADWVDPFIEFYALVAPIGLGFWIRHHVTPVKK